MEVYDYDYFENGIESGKSNYSRYRWIPELTIPMAMTIIDYLGIRQEHTVLDFGCSKGYLVKAMRWLNRQCYGVDISKYAINNCDNEVAKYLSHNLGTRRFDFCIAKDVFEHIELSELGCFLKQSVAKKYFVIIPLGENGKYRAPANNMDITHINCMTENEWIDFFSKYLDVDEFTFCVNGIKDNYYNKFPEAHGFFTLKNGGGLNHD